VPELPEVETVRAGLHGSVVGRRVTSALFLHPRSVRRHTGGADDLAARLIGRTLASAQRRGKYLWLPLDDGPECLIVHLGMSGQLLVGRLDAPGPHLRARLCFADDGPELWFVDQRTFGGLLMDGLVPDGPSMVPAAIAHIARDPLDQWFDDQAWIDSVRRRHTSIKRVLLDQTSVSGVGNIYADEALWRARLHGDRPVQGIRTSQLSALLAEVRTVLRASLTAGGTSFDALYVNVNGQSGYFDRSLDAYGRAGRPCHRCGTPIVRQRFMNRSSFSCPRCQKAPKAQDAHARGVWTSTP
jgi:formamidopyrimidine-DNA glycosylase